jgi:hypothetical protein
MFSKDRIENKPDFLRGSYKTTKQAEKLAYSFLPNAHVILLVFNQFLILGYF